MLILCYRRKYCQNQEFVRYFGVTLTTVNLLLTIVGIAHVLLLVFLVKALLPIVRSAPLAPVFIPALVCKVLMGWLLGGIFFLYYGGGDTIHYFNDASLLAQLAYDQPIEYLKVLNGQNTLPIPLVYANQPRALFFDKLVSVVAIFSYCNYWVASVYFSLLSFGGCWKLANCLSRRFPAHRAAVATAFLFYPSVVFWSAGILKESVALAAITLMVVQTLKLADQTYSKRSLAIAVLLLGVSGWMLWQLKYYYAVVLIPSLLSALLVQRMAQQKPALLQAAIFLAAWLLGGLLLSLLHPLLELRQFTELLLYKHDTMVQLSDPNYVIHFQWLDGSIGKFLLNTPWALFSGLFRPLVGEGTTLLQWIAALENTALLVLAAGALLHWRQAKVLQTDRIWVIAALFYIIVLSIVLAFASPNFGSLARYRVAFLPFFVFLILAGNPWVQVIQNRLTHRRRAVRRA